MRDIPAKRVEEAVARLCAEAGCDLPRDVERLVEKAREDEESPYGVYALDQICDNVRIAREGGVPMCQDTGIVLAFVDVGQDAHITGGSLEEAINRGIAKGYAKALMRDSVLADPLLDRVNTGDNTPGIVHARVVPGDKVSIHVMLKGAGSENMSALKMLKPAEGVEGVVDFVVDAVVSAGGNPCPPTIVGVGIGADAEGALLLSKRALLREAGSPNPDAGYARLEKEILRRINASGVGPQGFGGRVTSMAVQIETYPTHIAMLPVGVTLSCHASRHKEAVL